MKQVPFFSCAAIYMSMARRADGEPYQDSRKQFFFLVR